MKKITDINEFMDYVGDMLQEAEKYQLTTEVVAWALLSACPGDYDKALEHLANGFDEWVK